MARSHRFPILASLLFVPWSLQLYAGSVGLRFAWGMVSLDPLAVSLLVEYLSVGRSPLVFSWLLATGLYALAWAFTGVADLARGREMAVSLGSIDDRLVVGLLALAGIANASVAWTFSVQPGRVAIPIGTLVLWLVAWRWRAIR